MVVMMMMLMLMLVVLPLPLPLLLLLSVWVVLPLSLLLLLAALSLLLLLSLSKAPHPEIPSVRGAPYCGEEEKIAAFPRFATRTFVQMRLDRSPCDIHEANQVLIYQSERLANADLTS